MKTFAKITNSLSIEHLWPLVVMVGIFSFVCVHPIQPHDFWWHLAIGRDILAGQAIPLTDIYSYTNPGAAYPSYQQFWLMEAAMYLVYRAGGEVLTILIQALVVTLAYGLLLGVCYQRTKNWRAAALALFFAAAMGFGNWNVRPQLISYLYGAFFLFAIEQYKANKNWRWLLVFPFGMVLWVNSHGSFPIGLAFAGIWWFESAWGMVKMYRQEKAWIFKEIFAPTVAGALALVGCLANPRGVGIITYLKTLGGNVVVQNYITEWMPPTFDTTDGAVFLFGLLLLAVLMSISPRRPALGQVAYFLLFGYMGLNYIRAVVWFGIALSPYVAEHVAALLEKVGVARSVPAAGPAARRLNWIFVALLAFLSIFSLPWFKQALPLTEEKRGLLIPSTPVQATEYLLENKLPGHIFHAMPFGSYLIWKAQPEYPVFVDSRVELFSEETWADYLNITNGAYGWDEKLKRYGVNTLMLDPELQPALLRAAEASSEWQKVYQDAYVSLFTRR